MRCLHQAPSRQVRFGWRSTMVALALAATFVAGGAEPSMTALAATQPTTAAAAPDLSGFTQSVRVPYTKVPDFTDLRRMSVRVSVNGGPPLSLQVDTGSVGIILGASDVPHIDPHAPAGEMVYSSSGYGLYGVWTPATIAFLDARDANGQVPVARVPVLAARESRVVATQAVNGKGFKGSKNPHPYMFGVGFGRGTDPHPERNPFINLEAMLAGTMRRGYTITRDGYTLGLTDRSVGTGYSYQHLTGRAVSAETVAMRPGLRDWATSRGWVTVNGVRQPDMPILIDTGLTNFFIPKNGLAEPAELPAGTPVTVELLGGQLHYGFTVGDKDDPVSPSRVTWTVGKPTSNVNTGLKALAIYDYLYDADGGYLGLRPTASHR